MDLGIKGKRALVCASSKGLGRGCAEALAEAGVDLVMNARRAEALEAAARPARRRDCRWRSRSGSRWSWAAAPSCTCCGAPR